MKPDKRIENKTMYTIVSINVNPDAELYLFK